MSVSNLAIVFGPTLLGPPPEDSMAVLQDMQWQCKAIETILEHYAEIFVDAEEEEEGGDSAEPPAQPDGRAADAYREGYSMDKLQDSTSNMSISPGTHLHQQQV